MDDARALMRGKGHQAGDVQVSRPPATTRELVRQQYSGPLSANQIPSLQPTTYRPLSQATNYGDIVMNSAMRMASGNVAGNRSRYTLVNLRFVVRPSQDL